MTNPGTPPTNKVDIDSLNDNVIAEIKSTKQKEDKCKKSKKKK